MHTAGCYGTAQMGATQHNIQSEYYLARFTTVINRDRNGGYLISRNAGIRQGCLGINIRTTNIFVVLRCITVHQ